MDLSIEYELIARAGIVVEPFDESLAGAAFDAFRKYGKGRSNPAQLNLVDCVVYALARSRNVPRLVTFSAPGDL